MNPANVHTDWLRQLYVRELKALIAELELYPIDALVWQAAPGVTNSAGTIALHLCGNLQHFIGAVLGNTGYVRNRPLEFSARDLSRGDLIAEIQATIEMLERVMGAMPDSALLDQYPDVLNGLHVPVGLWLQHLSVHLGWHLGQVGYLRRIVTGESTTSGAVDMFALR